jgi:hypothetical protein
MRNVPNHIVSTLARCLPVILANIDREAMRRNLRLRNAVRLTKQLINKINKINQTNGE